MSRDPCSRFRLGGQLALVTGASGGLGPHFAGTLARAGAHVVLAARRRERVADAAAALKRAGARASAASLGRHQRGSVRDCFEQVAGTLGVPGVVINNTGVTVTKPLLQQEEADWTTCLTRT